MGGSTEEAQQDIGRFVAGKLNDYLSLGSTSLSVNLPNLVLPPNAGGFRLTHVHANVPGVLAAIDSLFASHGMNIEGQYLGTRGDVGYVITDTPRRLFRRPADSAAGNAGDDPAPGAIGG